MRAQVASQFSSSESVDSKCIGGQYLDDECRYLKSSKDPEYTVAQINAYPTTTNAVQVVTTLIYACMFHRDPPHLHKTC